MNDRTCINPIASPSKSTYDETAGSNSGGNFGIEFSLSKTTGADDPTGSLDLTFDGHANDNWHIFDESTDEWTNTYNDGSGTTEIDDGESTYLYTLDEVYRSEYDGDPGVTLGAGGPTESGSVTSGEEYTFDQVSSSDSESSMDRTSTGGYDDGFGTMYTMTEWDLWEDEYHSSETDHYHVSIGELSEEEEDSSETGAEDPPPATGDSGDTGDPAEDGDTEEGWTEVTYSDETCHTWDHSDSSGYSDTGGPECNGSSYTERTEWESLIDQAMEEMGDEAAMEAGATGATEMESGGGSGEAGGCATCAEAGDGGSDDADPSVQEDEETLSIEGLARRRAPLIQMRCMACHGTGVLDGRVHSIESISDLPLAAQFAIRMWNHKPSDEYLGVLGAGGLGLLVIGGVEAAAVASEISLGIGTQAVVAHGLGEGAYAGLLIDGTVYVGRFHTIAWQLAGRAEPIAKYGIVIIDATGKVIGWL